MAKEKLGLTDEDDMWLTREEAQMDRDPDYTNPYEVNLSEKDRLQLIKDEEEDHVVNMLDRTQLKSELKERALRMRDEVRKFAKNPQPEDAGKSVRVTIVLGLENHISAEEDADRFPSMTHDLGDAAGGRQLHTNPNLPPNTSPSRTTLLEDGSLGLRD